MNKGVRNRTFSRVIVIVLSTLLMGTLTGIVPVTARGNHFDCLLYKTAPNGSVDQSSSQMIARQQSLYGCEGWLYAFAIRVGHIVYGGWGSALLDAEQNGRIGQYAASQKRWDHPIADYMLDLLDSHVQSLNRFWANRFSGSQIPYSRPGVVRVTSPIPTVCRQSTTRTDSYYCRQNHTIYVGQGLLETVLRSGGNLTPALVLAHEWGHHIQSLLNILDSYNTKSVEIQADCFAGVYAEYQEGLGLLDPGDADSAAKLMFEIGDGPNASTLSPWFDKNAHGTGQERRSAFFVGVKEGINGCRKLR
jgi:uncharacterized protein